MMAWFIGGLILLRILGAAFIILLIARIVAGARGRHHGALWILSRRFAEGQITEEQFRAMRDVLESD
jgi:uncharacterized membrane protein